MVRYMIDIDFGSILQFVCNQLQYMSKFTVTYRYKLVLSLKQQPSRHHSHQSNKVVSRNPVTCKLLTEICLIQQHDFFWDQQKTNTCLEQSSCGTCAEPPPSIRA